MNARGEHRVVALALPDVVAFDLAVAAQIFGHRDERGRYAFTVCAETPGAVPTTTGYTLWADLGLDALAAADTVVVPGFYPLEEPSAAVLDALRRAYDRGARVVSMCVGAFAMAAAGLLDGRRATTHRRHTGELAARFPAVTVCPDVLYVDQTPILTGAGAAAGIDLCLHLYRQDHGEEAAAEVAGRMMAPARRPGGQAPCTRRPLPKPRQDLAETRAWAAREAHLPLGVADLARHAGMTPRTFARRFRAETGTTPVTWLAAERLAGAKRLLEATDMTMEEVARRSGLGTAANLRARFTRSVGTTPSAYRRAFRPSAPP